MLYAYKRIVGTKMWRVTPFCYCAVVALTVRILAILHTSVVSPDLDRPNFPTGSSVSSGMLQHDVSTSLEYKDITMTSFLGMGMASTVFGARIPKIDDGEYVMKIVKEKYLHYCDIETKAYSLLSKEPRSPSIPPLMFDLTTADNPFRTWKPRDFERLGLASETRIYDIRKAKKVCIQVFPKVPHSGFPAPTMFPQIAVMMYSLLEALDFAHGRNVMNVDISPNNVKFDAKTGTSYLFDWNGARFFEPGKIPLHQEGEDPSIVPPEARGDENAVHLTVYGHDMYASGILLNTLLCDKYHCPAPKSNVQDEYWHAYNLASWMTTADPYKRPSAAEAMEHEFFALEL